MGTMKVWVDPRRLSVFPIVKEDDTAYLPSSDDDDNDDNDNSNMMMMMTIF